MFDDDLGLFERLEDLAVEQLGHRVMSAAGHKRKSATTILMSVIPPKAEVARRRWHFRYVPKAEVARRRWYFRFVPKGDIGVSGPDGR